MNRWDALFIAGLLCIAAGAAMIYPPMGLIVFGAGLAAMGVAGAVGEGRIRSSAPPGGDQP